jgi:hypothetical protein
MTNFDACLFYLGADDARFELFWSHLGEVHTFQKSRKNADSRTYQREYMRKWRALAKLKADLHGADHGNP